ncbi:DUF4145 domain-containing protein [Afifella aestuarii]|uniref:DUF4145 domain-containing protein n=1 Tax=Afifella aestuarii TaxID=1909496 RepID=UPI000FE4046A|nr:DUF4145 domain-containing protein [Afifella aestuarii]
MEWTCPYCGHLQTVTKPRLCVQESIIDVGTNRYGSTAFRVTSIGCSNPKCGEIQITFEFGTAQHILCIDQVYKCYTSRTLIRPESSAKPQPEYIPEAIRQDYIEACRICELSPKAAATLSRRCIQGIIRDFTGISKGRLIDEIRTLRSDIETGTAPSGVTTESVDAIDHVRSIGNIGAHMEKDINTIIDVEPLEARALIELIELLFEEWYVARKTRKDRLAQVQKIAENKASLKNPPQKKKIEETS